MFHLRKLIFDKDFSWLYNNWHRFDTNCFRCKEDFERWFQERLSDYFIEFFIFADSDDKAAGFISMCDFRKYDMTCKVAMLLPMECETKLLSSFIDHIFCEYPIVIAFCEVLCDSYELLSLKKTGFRTQAHLVDYRFRNGTYVDAEILAFSKD